MNSGRYVWVSSQFVNEKRLLMGARCQLNSWTIGHQRANMHTQFFGKTRWQSSARRWGTVAGKESTYIDWSNKPELFSSLYSRFGDLPCWPPPPHPAYFAEDQFEYLDCDSCSPLCGFSQRTLIFSKNDLYSYPFSIALLCICLCSLPLVKFLLEGFLKLIDGLWHFEVTFGNFLQFRL